MPSGRVDPRLGDRQPAQGRVGAGRAEHERHAGHRRADGVAVSDAFVVERLVSSCPRASRRDHDSRPLVLKFGGELLEDRAHLATVVAADARASRRGTPLVDRPRRRQGNRRRAENRRASKSGRSTACASPTSRRSTSSSRCWPALVNTRFVAALNTAGVAAVGPDRRRRRVRPLVESAPPHRSVDGGVVDLGRVGIPTETPTCGCCTRCVDGGFVPVVACIGIGDDGRLLNVNADTFAGHLAARLGARRLVIAGTTPGVLDESGATLPVLEAAGGRAARRRRHGHGRHDRQAARVRARAGGRRGRCGDRGWTERGGTGRRVGSAAPQMATRIAAGL